MNRIVDVIFSWLSVLFLAGGIVFFFYFVGKGKDLLPTWVMVTVACVWLALLVANLFAAGIYRVLDSKELVIGNLMSIGGVAVSIFYIGFLKVLSSEVADGNISAPGNLSARVSDAIDSIAMILPIAIAAAGVLLVVGAALEARDKQSKAN
jgi:hypothetical protein